jgi:hypothetical protein
VPRDVVFGKFATVGGVKESWTAPVFILSAEFADVLPADEDPMPPDGNPHPLPGNLQHDHNLFVNPQFPEIGWDALQDNVNNVQGNENEQMGEAEENFMDAQESMVMNPSVNSVSSVNGHEVNQLQVPGVQHMEVVQVGRVLTVFGPVRPPQMVWDSIFQSMMPALLSKTIPLSMQVSPFVFLKRTWEAAFDPFKNSQLLLSEDRRESGVRPRMIVRARQVARTLNFDDEDSQICTPILAVSSVTAPKKRTRKTLVVLPEQRRFTRSCLKNDGCRPAPVLSAQPRLKKKVRAKFLLENLKQQGDADVCQDSEEVDPEQMNIPATPIHVMQKVGEDLGMDPSKLTREQLEAEPDSSSATNSNDDD